MHTGKMLDHLRHDEEIARTLLVGTLLRSGVLLATVTLIAILVIALLLMQ